MSIRAPKPFRAPSAGSAGPVPLARLLFRGPWEASSVGACSGRDVPVKHSTKLLMPVSYRSWRRSLLLMMFFSCSSSVNLEPIAPVRGLIPKAGNGCPDGSVLPVSCVCRRLSSTLPVILFHSKVGPHLLDIKAIVLDFLCHLSEASAAYRLNTVLHSAGTCVFADRT